MQNGTDDEEVTVSKPKRSSHSTSTPVLAQRVMTAPAPLTEMKPLPAIDIELPPRANSAVLPRVPWSPKVRLPLFVGVCKVSGRELCNCPGLNGD